MHSKYLMLMLVVERVPQGTGMPVSRQADPLSWVT